jgi:hypothetical protein
MKMKLALALTTLIVSASIAAAEFHKQQVVSAQNNPAMTAEYAPAGYPIEYGYGGYPGPGYPIEPGYPVEPEMTATPRNSVQPTVEPTPVKDPDV